MKEWPMQVAIHYAHPKDSLHICQHYLMCRAPQEMHTVHYELEWLLQYQEQLVFVYQEELQDAQVVQRSRCEVSYCPPCQFYFFLCWRVSAKLKSFAKRITDKIQTADLRSAAQAQQSCG